MGMVISEYAKSRHISYESARKQVRRYTKELKGHTEKVGNVTELDEYAVDFLDQHRQRRQIVANIPNEEYEQQITNLRAEVDKLRQELIKAKSETVAAQQEVINTHKQYQLSLEQKDKELSTYKPTIFGLYKRVKLPEGVQDHGNKEQEN